jgi:deoxyadenosine/deoxycytidine kinase
MDRSVFSDCVFADVNFQEGSISAEGKFSKVSILV